MTKNSIYLLNLQETLDHERNLQTKKKTEMLQLWIYLYYWQKAAQHTRFFISKVIEF